MKIFLCFLLLASSVYASGIHEYVEAAPATVARELKVTTGVSSQSRAQDNQGNYAFAYKEDHNEGGTFRKESGNAYGQIIGSYGLRTNDGRVRIVNYVADDLGFRAAIATNEPGTAAQAPAATSISSPGVAVQPAVAVQSAVAVEPAVAVEQLHHGPTDLHAVNQPLVANHAPIVSDNHGPTDLHAVNQPLVANHAPIVSDNHGPADLHAINAVNQPLVANGPIVEAPVALIKNYASAIYGPSLLSFNRVNHGAVAVNQPLVESAPIVDNHRAIAVNQPLVANEQYYEPSLYYSNPSGIGYLAGTNIGAFGYQLIKKKK